MSSVRIKFEFSDGSAETEDFEGCDGVLGDVEIRAEEMACDKNMEIEEDGDEVECDGWSVYGTLDTDYPDEADCTEFDDLDEWGRYCDNVDQHGEAYVLRYADVGEYGHDDDYVGCYGCFQEYAEELFDDCMDCPDNLRQYICMESWAKDLSYDYSEYEGSEGVHVFRC